MAIRDMSESLDGSRDFLEDVCVVNFHVGQHGVPDFTQFIVGEIRAGHDVDQEAQRVDGRHLVVGVRVLVGLRGHHSDKVSPLFHGDLKGTDDGDAEAEVAHVHLVHLSITAQFLQQGLLCLSTDPLVHLEPGAVFVGGCTILVEHTARTSVLEVDRGTLAHNLLLLSHLCRLLLCDDHE